MKVLVDTNVVLDVLLDRAPHADSSSRIFTLVEESVLVGCLCATTLTTVHYLIGRVVSRQRSLEEIGKLLQLFEIAPVNRGVLAAAAEGVLPDFEDDVLYRSGAGVGVDAIVTRNTPDFQPADLPVYTPDDLLALLAARGSDDRGPEATD